MTEDRQERTADEVTSDRNLHPASPYLLYFTSGANELQAAADLCQCSSILCQCSSILLLLPAVLGSGTVACVLDVGKARFIDEVTRLSDDVTVAIERKQHMQVSNEMTLG